jgi:molecular chaperone HtpG
LKDIFLRELISNASDALDKMRYESLTKPNILKSEKELVINIIPDKQHNTLSIRDTGIGMTKAELISNLGTIAKSGTKAFMEGLSRPENVNMIGQFGVGFYSAFLVADKVQFITKTMDGEQYVWESGAGGYFSITRDTVNPPLGRGSEVRLFLKEDQLNYLEEGTIKDVVKVHSEFISYPIELVVEKEVGLQDNRLKEVVTETEELNLTKPLWTRPPNQVDFSEYAHFYRVLTGDWQEPQAVKHFSVEGQLEFCALLYIPKNPPLYAFEPHTSTNGIKLYVRRVFIMDNCEALVPEWLNFVQGIVDSEDLPLNISRESLQNNKILKVICKNIVKKCIEMLYELTTYDDYEPFYNAFVAKIKLGIIQDDLNRAKMARLLRYYSIQSMHEMISFDDYIDRMHENQRCIYYMVSESRMGASNSPFLESFKNKGIDVILMTDPMDEYALDRLKTYNGIPLVNIVMEGVEPEEVDLSTVFSRQAQEQEYHKLCTVMKNVLGNRVEKVVLSHLLTDSACILSTSQEGWSANMERIMKAQALRSQTNVYIVSRRILELNPEHRIIKILSKRVLSNITHTTKDLIFLMFETALLVSGFTLDDPSHFANRVNQLISVGLDAEEQDDEHPKCHTR